ncbi:hypothetical protein EDD11_000612 [Mortierella claussenii]|nr:hypothetical protein EDD11_000612 [Mortierella claussenii]
MVLDDNTKASHIVSWQASRPITSQVWVIPDSDSDQDIEEPVKTGNADDMDVDVDSDRPCGKPRSVDHATKPQIIIPISSDEEDDAHREVRLVRPSKVAQRKRESSTGASDSTSKITFLNRYPQSSAIIKAEQGLPISPPIHCVLDTAKVADDNYGVQGYLPRDTERLVERDTGRGRLSEGPYSTAIGANEWEGEVFGNAISETPTLKPIRPCSLDTVSDEDFDDEEYDYDADPLFEGELEISHQLREVTPIGISFVELINKSYHASRDRLLAYQQSMVHQGKKRALLTGHVRRPKISIPADFSAEEMETIFAQVTEYTKTLKPVDWGAVANEVFRFTGYRRTGHACLDAFEHAIGHYQKTPKRCRHDLTTMHSKIPVTRLLAMRERGASQPSLLKDMLLLRQIKNYACATSFNYSSGSVVDMAFKPSTFKLAIANVATQDIYNRSGNLLHCDLNKGITKPLEGHQRTGTTGDQPLTVTVNDIKLSYSKNFFISGADDRKIMLWDTETGHRVNTIEDARSRVHRVAILEDSQSGQDIFATCTSHGQIHIYALDEDGQVLTRNKELDAPGGKRSISSISFGYGHFWDCLAAGMEGVDRSSNNDGLHGQIAFYDANYLVRKSVGDLGFRQAATGTTDRSVSSLSFSSSGKYLVCGTSGRSTAGDDEKGDGIVRVFDVEHAKEIESAVSGHEDVNLVDFSPCEQYVISCSHNNEVAVFDRRWMTGPPLHRLHHINKEDDDSNAGITSALWWPRGLGTSQTMLVTGGGDGAVKLWDIRRATEDTEIWSFEANLGPIARLSSSPSFEHLVVGGDTGAVSVYTPDHGIISQYHDRPMAMLSHDYQ